MINIEQLFSESFYISNGIPHYISFEEKEKSKIECVTMGTKIRNLVDYCTKLNVNRTSFLINRSTEHYLNLSNTLQESGFNKYASKIEVYRDLVDIGDSIGVYEWRSIGDGTVTEEAFKLLWEHCRSWSDNTTSTLTMDEHLESVKCVVGENWRYACKVIYINNKPIGITIPHIELGTTDEGRLYYFGILPEERGNGYSPLIHYQSLYVLKQMGATYYVGSTHEANKRMQRVFLKNGCSVKARTESYYLFINT